MAVLGYRQAPFPEPQHSHLQPEPSEAGRGLPQASPEVLPPLGQASGRPGPCLAYHFQFPGRGLNTSEGPFEKAAAREGVTK